MAVTIGASTCWGIQHWGVFTLTEGVWRVVLKQPSYLVPPLVAVGSGIRETTAVHRDGLARRLRAGNAIARLALELSQPRLRPLDQVTRLRLPRRRSSSRGQRRLLHSTGSRTRRVNLGCGSERAEARLREVRVRTAAMPATASLGVTGRAIVPRMRATRGLIESAIARVLGYGKTWSGGGLRCTSAESPD